MSKNHNWYIAGISLIGVAVGIVFCGAFSNVMHWAGSTPFCGEFCHSMDVTYAAYKKGLHYNTRSGMHAGCSDCHLLNYANEHNNPIEYTAMLLDKANAGTHSLIGEIQGSLSTPEKQIAERERMAKHVRDQMKERNFSNCRACHDVTAMNNPKKKMISKFHQKMTVDAEPKVDCVACHKNAGHDYKAAQAEIDAIVAASKK